MGLTLDCVEEELGGGPAPVLLSTPEIEAGSSLLG